MPNRLDKYVVTGSSVWGRAFQLNAEVVGGLKTGSLDQFVSLPVNVAAGVPAKPALFLSSSFSGFSGSIIQAINRAMAVAQEGAEVTWSEVSGAIKNADSALGIDKSIQIQNGATLYVTGPAQLSSSIKVQGIAQFNGNVDLGNASSDTISVTGQFDTDLVPSSNSTSDLGTSTKQWAEAHVDTGFIDTVKVGTLQAADGSGAATIANTSGIITIPSSVLTTADINGGTADNVVIGGATAAAGTFTTLNATNSNLGTLASDVDCADQIFTNVDINSGVIDNTVIGGSTAVAGNFSTLNASTSIATAGTFTAGGTDFTISAGGALSQAGTSNFTGAASFGVDSGANAGSSTLFIAGDDAAGAPKMYRLAVSGGILRAEQQ